jgi:hypothetical protein
MVLLDNGFFPIQFLVYDRMRIALLRLYHALVDAGVEVYGVKTDCFVVSRIPDRFPHISRDRRVENIGKWRQEEGTIRAPREAYTMPDNTASPIINMDVFRDARNMSVFLRTLEAWTAPLLPRMSEDLPMLKEGYKMPPPVPIFKPFAYDHVDAPLQTFNGKELCVVDDGTLVLGACAGSGKTATCIANAMGRTLIVAPTNKRVAEFKHLWATERDKFPARVVDVVAMTTTSNSASRNFLTFRRSLERRFA